MYCGRLNKGGKSGKGGGGKSFSRGAVTAKVGDAAMAVAEKVKQAEKEKPDNVRRILALVVVGQDQKTQ